MIKWHKIDGQFWIRIFGWGIAIKDVNKHPLLFSERNGYVKFIQIGKWVVTRLAKR